MATSHLVTSKHIEQFEKQLHDIIDIEHEQLSLALDKDIKSESEEACLWRRYDQLRFVRAILEGKYKFDPEKAIMGDNEIIELTG